jgi:PEP-CTERM motif
MRLFFATGALAAALGIGFGPTAHAGPISPFGILQVGPSSVNLTLTPDPQNSDVLSFEGLLTSDLFDVQVNGTLDAAGSILFGLAAQNLGTDPLAVSVSLLTPIDPLSPENTVQSGITGTLTDGATDGFSLQPTFGDMDGDGVAELMVVSAGDPINLGVDVGPGTTAAGVYGPFLASQGLAGDPLLRSLQLDLALSLSGNGDSAALQGFAQIAPVPEPSTLLMLSMGAAGMMAGVRRRRSRN